MPFFFCLFFLLLSPVPTKAQEASPREAQPQEWRKDFIRSLKNGGAMVVDSHGKTLVSHRVHDHFVPASTIKVATAASALHHLGEDFRFKTEIYTTPQGSLVVKGYGDPSLVSEELAQIAHALRQKGLTSVNGMILDTSYFSPHILIDGVERSANPYDALNSALLVNFNTINIRKFKNGRIESAEPQTPLTSIAREAGKRYRSGTHRVNLAGNPKKAVKYVGELLAVFLEKEEIQVSGSLHEGKLPDGATLIYEHRSHQNLREILRDMLDYSTNLTANQIFLVTGAHALGPPATVEKGIRVLTEFLKNRLGWHDFRILEGSGLSHQNRVTPAQMMKLLAYFEPYRGLLPLKDNFVLGKTGTLLGVNTYAGYFNVPYGIGDVKFVILINDKVPYDYKFKLAKMLYEHLNKSSGQ